MKERLQKLIAQTGIASRRKAEAFITDGKVTVNGLVVVKLGTSADPLEDHIKVNGKLINPKLKQRKNRYILINKPKGYLSSVSDTENRKLVTALVPKRYGKLFPVGRLDFNTEGLIILTNDGNFSNKISSTQTIPKVYEVKVKGIPSAHMINRLRKSVTLGDGFRTAPTQIKKLSATKKNAWFEMTLYEGHNRQIRKMFDVIGFSVIKLRRTRIGHITNKALAVGEYRNLEATEVKLLG